jgi:hypothetical protein
LLPVLDPTDKNKLLYIVAEGRDINEKKKAEAEVMRKNNELQELYDKIKVNFLSLFTFKLRHYNIMSSFRIYELRFNAHT